MQCASYIKSAIDRCLNTSKEGSVFCEVHSPKFYKLYTAYKRVDIITEIRDNMPIKYYLKKLVRCEKAMKLRIEYREKAIAISARDIGHSMRIDILQECADKCVENLERLFLSSQKKEIVSEQCSNDINIDNDNDNPIKNNNTLYIQQSKKACKSYSCLRKRNEDWKALTSNAIKNDDLMLNNATNKMIEMFLSYPTTSGFSKESLMDLGILLLYFRGFFNKKIMYDEINLPDLSKVTPSLYQTMIINGIMCCGINTIEKYKLYYDSDEIRFDIPYKEAAILDQDKMNDILNLVNKLQISNGSYMGSLTNLVYTLHWQGSWLISKDITCFIVFDGTGIAIKDSPYNYLFNSKDLDINPHQISNETIYDLMLEPHIIKIYPNIGLARLDYMFQYELKRIKVMMNFPKLNRMDLIKKDIRNFLQHIENATPIDVDRNLIPPIFTIEELNNLGINRYNYDVIVKDTKNAAKKLIKYAKKANNIDDESLKDMYNLIANFGKEALKYLK
jgi:hypothetical protein